MTSYPGADTLILGAPDRTRIWASVVLHLPDGMGQIQGATTSATTHDLSKTPTTYDIPHSEGVQQAANSSYPGAD